MTILIFKKLPIAAMCLIVCTDPITIYEIIIFNIDVLSDNVGISKKGLVIHTHFQNVPYILLPYVKLQFGQIPHLYGNYSIVTRSFNVSTNF